MKEKNELDILIPVFNESENIVKTLKNILSVVECNYRILICYDYNEDPTLNIIKKNFSQNSQIVFVKNFSKGFNNALISGFEDSTAEAVCPSRFVKGGKMIGNPLLKGFLIKVASFFLVNFTSFPIKDPTNSFRLFSRELINKVKIESNKGFTLSLELTAKAHRLGYQITEIPTTWIERDTGKSRFKLIAFILPYTKWLFYIIKTSIFYKNAK